jgi:hypothetical protein
MLMSSESAKGFELIIPAIDKCGRVVIKDV